MKCGLLGQGLRHSYSPAIHALLGSYEYALYDKPAAELEDFLRRGDFHGLNVTMPYKKAVIPYLDDLSPIARRLGAVNTILRRPDGSLWGHNTDYAGFQTMASKSGLSFSGKKCLVLGSGGASATAVAVLEALGAEVLVISRQGENTYDNLPRHRDAQILVNTTPVGMYPHCGKSPVALEQFPCLEGVLDVIYNPLRTQLLLDAEKLGLRTMNGLWMLLAQAAESAQCFTGMPVSSEKAAQTYEIIRKQAENIILVGMPGCGKSTIAARLAHRLGKPLVDVDEEIEKTAKKSIPAMFAQDGIDAFRRMETQILCRFGQQSGLVIATGGGCVTRPENYDLLRQNGRIIWLQRDIFALPTAGRPLSTDLQVMYAARKPLYEVFSDCSVENNGTVDETVARIMEVIG